MNQWIRCWWEDFKAWRRGEERIAPRPIMRGRVYRSKGDDRAELVPRIKLDSIGTARLSARVKRAGSDTYEEPILLKEWENVDGR